MEEIVTLSYLWIVLNLRSDMKTVVGFDRFHIGKYDWLKNHLQTKLVVSNIFVVGYKYDRILKMIEGVLKVFEQKS